MKYQSVEEYLEYTGLADQHPDLMRLLEAEQEENAAFIKSLYDQIDSYLGEA